MGSIGLFMEKVISISLWKKCLNKISFGAANFVETFSLVNVILMFLSARSDVGLGTL